MKTYILSLGISLNGFHSDSDCSNWHKGNIHLADETVVNGEIRYCLDHDIVMLKNEAQTLTLSPVKVEYFVIFDNSLNETRSFYTLPYKGLNGYIRKKFFELLYHGKISLLNREEKMMIANHQNFNNLSDPTEWVLVDKYYVLDEYGEVTYFSGNTKDLLNHMQRHANAILTFIDDHQLDTSRREDLIAVLQYYNTLHNH